MVKGQNNDSGVQSDQKAPSLKVSELHHFILGIPHRRPLGKGKGCHLGPLTHLWGFLLTFWAPSPPLRSHSLISYSIEKGLSFTFSFLRLSPPPAPRCETLWLAGLQLACPPLPAPQLCWPQVSTCPKSGENLQLLGPVHTPSGSSPGRAPPWPKSVSGETPASRWNLSHDGPLGDLGCSPFPPPSLQFSTCALGGSGAQVPPAKGLWAPSPTQDRRPGKPAPKKAFGGPPKQWTLPCPFTGVGSYQLRRTQPLPWMRVSILVPRDSPSAQAGGHLLRLSPGAALLPQQGLLHGHRADKLTNPPRPPSSHLGFSFPSVSWDLIFG